MGIVPLHLHSDLGLDSRAEARLVRHGDLARSLSKHALQHTVVLENVPRRMRDGSRHVSTHKAILRRCMDYYPGALLSLRGREDLGLAFSVVYRQNFAAPNPKRSDDRSFATFHDDHLVFI